MWQIISTLFKSLSLRLEATIAWLFSVLASAFIVQNYENWAEDRGIADVIDKGAPPSIGQSVMSALTSLGEHVVTIATFIAGPFGAGFTLAAVLSSLPDVRAVVQRYRARRAERAASAALKKSRERLELSNKPRRWRANSC
jgi:hypothetical protein